ALAVAEAQGISRRFGKLNPRVAAFVECPRQPLQGRGAHMMAAMRANLAVGCHVAMKDHLLTRRALMPEIVRHLAPGEQGADLRANVFGKPAHSCRSRGLRFLGGNPESDTNELAYRIRSPEDPHPVHHA